MLLLASCSNAQLQAGTQQVCNADQAGPALVTGGAAIASATGPTGAAAGAIAVAVDPAVHAAAQAGCAALLVKEQSK